MGEGMPRPRRNPAPDFLRHIMMRGNGRMQIFFEDRDYLSFLGLLGETVDGFNLECWDFCAMPNHVHLALVNREPNLSAAMQYLNGEFARWWNFTYRHVGHVFQGRFKDQIVEGDSYLLTLTRYIALNPIRAKLVQEPEAWKWSSYRCLAGFSVAPDFLSCEHILRQFSDADLRVLRERYIRHVGASNPREDMRMEAFRSRRRIVGSRDFRQRVAARGDQLIRPVENCIAVAPGFI